MQGLRPDVVAAILRSATTSTPDPRLEGVLGAFKREWEAIANVRYPRLAHDREDVIQQAFAKIVSPEKLARLDDPIRVRAWARSIFVNTAIDMLRERRLEWRYRSDLGDGVDDTDTVLRERLPAQQPGPEEIAQDRERLALALELVQQVELARLRFLGGVTEKALAVRFGLTRDGVAGQLKRLRHRIRRLLGDVE